MLFWGGVVATLDLGGVGVLLLVGVGEDVDVVPAGGDASLFLGDDSLVWTLLGDLDRERPLCAFFFWVVVLLDGSLGGGSSNDDGLLLSCAFLVSFSLVGLLVVGV